MDIKQIERAERRLSGIIHNTPVNVSRTFSDMSGAELYLKCENLQKTGSFKVRGAYNKLAQMLESGGRREGERLHLVASSAGNHAQGVAYAAASAGAQATIVMPAASPLAKVEATRGYGPEVILYGDSYDAAYALARQLCDERGAKFIHPFDDEEIIAGQGTIGLEILRSMPTVDAIVVPAGGGGLLAGIAACVKQINPRVKIFGVQASGADAIVRSFREKRHIATETSITIADGIAVRNPGVLTTQLIREFADDMVTVTDDELAGAILLLLERMKLVVEPAGAAALTAAIMRKIPYLIGKRVVCVLSGGNIDVAAIHKVVEQGLISRGRL